MPKNLKTITFLLASLRGGGAERVILTIAKGLSDKGYKVDIVLVKAEGEYLEQVHQNIHLVDLKSNRAIFCIPKLIKYFRQENPAVVFSSLPHVSLATLIAHTLAISKSHVFLIEHNTLSLSVKNSNTAKGKMLPLFMKLFYPISSGIIAVSEGVASDLVSILKISRERIQVIYNPVVTNSILELSMEPSKHPWLGNNQPPVVLGVGRLTYAKNFQLLIRSFAKVRDTLAARLIILGDGPDRPELEHLVETLNLSENVSMPGFVENPYAYYRNASVFVLSSRWEGLPTVLIEALACGTHVISTDCPSGPREILEHGRWGTLVQCPNESKLAHAISDVLVTSMPPVGQDFLNRFSLEQSVSKYQSIIERVKN